MAAKRNANSANSKNINKTAIFITPKRSKGIKQLRLANLKANALE